MAAVRTGLDRLGEGEGPDLRGGVALLCHPASVDRRLRSAREVIESLGVPLHALWGPEHGLDAAAQDMEVVDSREGDSTPTHSLYGDEFESLVPTEAMLHGAEWLVIDLQDIGSRYYTYVWTAMLAAEVALGAGHRVLILDRPNPIGATADLVEGGIVEPGEDSFVGLHPVAVRHSMTLAELVTLALDERARESLARLEVLECTGYRREMFFGDTGLPWVLPSPNMPTLDTALVYPGQCLWEGTNLSEGRGTTRPFEFFGAPWVRPRAWIESLDAADFPGCSLRAAAFRPTFQKYAGATCHGIQIHVEDASAVRSLRSTWALLRSAYALGRARGFAWRTERYEFVEDRPAIDLLAGGPWLRTMVEAGESVDAMHAHQQAGRAAFLDRRASFLRY